MRTIKKHELSTKGLIQMVIQLRKYGGVIQIE